MNKNVENDALEIDLLQLARALWQKAWVIALVTVICTGAALGFTAVFICPLYKATP